MKLCEILEGTGQIHDIIQLCKMMKRDLSVSQGILVFVATKTFTSSATRDIAEYQDFISAVDGMFKDRMHLEKEEKENANQISWQHVNLT